MKYEPINGGFKKLKEDLAAMTFKDKLNHLWTYYKGTLVILAILIAIGSIVVTSCKARNTETLLAGIAINAQLSEQGQAYVGDEYYQKLATGGLQQVIYSETIHEDFTKTAALEESYTMLMSLIALSASEQLDYLLLDEIALKNLLPHSIYLDLREFFTEDELEAMGDNVIWGEIGTEDERILMPFAIKITDMPFIEENATHWGDTYFSVVVNSPRKDTVRDFWNYLHAWAPAA